MCNITLDNLILLSSYTFRGFFVQLCTEELMSANSWDETHILDQELPYDASEFFEMLKSLQKREKFAKASGDLQELMAVFMDRARFFEVVQHPHYCHVKTASNINAFMWHLFWSK